MIVAYRGYVDLFPVDLRWTLDVTPFTFYTYALIYRYPTFYVIVAVVVGSVCGCYRYPARLHGYCYDLDIVVARWCCDSGCDFTDTYLYPVVGWLPVYIPTLDGRYSWWI